MAHESEITSRKRVVSLLSYLVILGGVIYLVYFKKMTPINQIANEIGWLSTVILGFVVLYLGLFAVISFPAVFHRWITDRSPRYIAAPWNE